MSQQYRMVVQNHVRSASHIIPQQNQKYHAKIPVQTQSTSLGSSISNNRSKSSVTKLTNFLITKSKGQCNYCVHQTRFDNISSKVNTKLYHKYSSSQNYYYTRDINEILTNARSGAVILFKDLMFLDENEEYLKRQYLLKEYPQKIKLLTEYYKFHQDIPRLFMLPTTNSLNNYHDRKRRLEYYRIAEIIEEENKKNPKRPPKGIVGDKPDNLETESSMQDQLQVGDQNAVGEILLNDISSFVNRGQSCQENENQRVQIKKQDRIKKRSVNQKKNQKDEISMTIFELNKKLDQIANNSHNIDESSMMMMSQITNNNNLQDFLKHMDQNVINYSNKPIKLVQKNQKEAIETQHLRKQTNIQNNIKDENLTIKPQLTNSKQSFKQKVSNLKLDDLDQLLKSKKSNTSNTEQQYSARSIQNIMNNKNQKLVQQIMDKIPQTSKNENQNPIKFEPQSTKSYKPISNNFVSNNKQHEEIKIKFDQKLNFQLNLKNLDYTEFTNLSLKSAKNKVQNDSKKIDTKESKIQSPIKNNLSTNYSPRQSIKNNNKPEQIETQISKKTSNPTNLNYTAKKKINYTKKQSTPSFSQNKKIVLSLDEDNDYQYKQQLYRPQPQSAQTHRAFNFTNTPSTTKTTEPLKDDLKAKQASVNSIHTSNKTKKIKSPRNSNQNSIALSKPQNFCQSSDIQQDVGRAKSKFQFNQPNINNNNINVNLNLNQPKKALHKHTKSETFNFNLNLNPVYDQSPYENFKQISYNQSPNCRELQKKPDQLQKEVMAKLSQFNFSHNFMKSIKEKEKDMGVIQSERGTNSTLKQALNKNAQKQTHHSKKNSQNQQQIKNFQI